MNRGVFLLGVIFSFSLVVAGACAPNITLINQDPYPAVPGDYVKLVFQIEDISGEDCEDIIFNLVEDYPLIFNPGETGLKSFKKVDYLQDYNENILVPYKVRVDEDALDGTSPIEIYFQNKGQATTSKTFDLEIEDTRTEFEVFIEDYNNLSKELTFQILNSGDSDIEALTVTIPKQAGITVKGTNKIIAGDLDSNEYTTVTFEAQPSDGLITVDLTYSDAINVRRSETSQVTYDSEYFTNRFSDEKSTSVWSYIFVVFILLLLGYFILGRFKRKKKLKQL